MAWDRYVAPFGYGLWLAVAIAVCALSVFFEKKFETRGNYFMLCHFNVRCFKLKIFKKWL
jgi:hypothetical protein